MREYKGNLKENYEKLKVEDKKIQNCFVEKEPYIPSKELIEAVNLAIELRRPLLLEGEPGCGKTRLAYSLAYELGYPIFECYIRTDSIVKEFLYDFDALNRLYKLQEMKTLKEMSEEEINREKFIELKELGKAIELSSNGYPSIVLIDEIDKADIDFPNDLLLLLDRLQFKIPEIDKKYDAMKNNKGNDRKDNLPIFIITSNLNKELPKAFLRRCIFHYIEFPQKEELEDILKTHFEQNELLELDKEALNIFWNLTSKEEINWHKKPSTSEFIDWVKALKTKGIDIEGLKNKKVSEIPFLKNLLIKTNEDLKEVERNLDE